MSGGRAVTRRAGKHTVCGLAARREEASGKAVIMRLAASCSRQAGGKADAMQRESRPRRQAGKGVVGVASGWQDGHYLLCRGTRASGLPVWQAGGNVVTRDGQVYRGPGW